MNIEQKVLQFIEKHQLIENNRTVVVGVSGGPDSLALLHFLKKWQQKWNLHVVAITVDHQLRGRVSQEDVRFVEDFCHAQKIPLIIKAVDVNMYKQTNRVGTQVAARELRYDAYAKAMEEYEADYLALGHHGDDQIETMTMSLMRSANLSGMLGIPFERSFHRGKIIRPFLAVNKEEIESYCVQNELNPRIDSSNFEATYTRNDIRMSVVPKFKQYNASMHVTIQQLTETFQEDERFLLGEAEKLFALIVKTKENPRMATMQFSLLKKHAVSLQRRVFRLTLDYLYEHKQPPLYYKHEEILLSLLQTSASNQHVKFPEQLIIEKEYDTLTFYFQLKSDKGTSFSANIHSIPTSILLPDGSELVITYTENFHANDDPHTYICSQNQIELPLTIRTRKSGDRITYEGLKGSKKLKNLFIDEKIPKRQRDQTIIVCDNKEELLWVVGLRKGLLKVKVDQGPYILFQLKTSEKGDKDA